MSETKKQKTSSDLRFTNIKTVLIANRGEIACRIIASLAIYSKEDTGSLHVSQADQSVLIPGTGSQAYINIDSVLDVAVKVGADVVIPGYGFLSENSNFAQKLEEKGIIFAGPSAENVEQFGLKHIARQLAIKANVPVVPGTELVDTLEQARNEGAKIGYPLMLKSTAGGGGMGLKVCHDESQLEQFFNEVKSRGQSLFSNTGVFIEKYVQNARHIEIQLFGNGLGDVITFGERECSIQRRHQKVIEESPSPFVDFELRQKLSQCAISLASEVKYKSAGTIEFLVDDDTSEFYFLEMNTRLQVEHGISELVYDVDLVYLMLLQSDYEVSKSGIPLSILQSQSSCTLKNNILNPNGHAIEVRLYAENPIKDFAPSPGILHQVEFPDKDNIRIDHWISTGTKVSPYFDPLLAKIMSWGPTREDATTTLIEYLKSVKICGPPTNIYYLGDILHTDNFKTGNTLTSFLNNFDFKPKLIEFEEAGAYTTIQDLPGRTVNGGVPTSGPVDSLSLQIANIIVGNDKYIECLEINLTGPTIKFYSDALIALAGADFEFEINDQEQPLFTQIFVKAGDVVKIGSSNSKYASKSYLAIKGGFPDVAKYLGSKSCTPTLSLGGHQGRVIFPGDCLTIVSGDSKEFTGYSLPKNSRPNYDVESWTVRMLRGPHDTEDIISEEGLKQLYNTTYHVNLNSNRGGTRLDGPSIDFSRTSGGDGGSHPSNILEYTYPFGGLSVVGSQLVMYGPDGGTLSGFICISVPTMADFWKIGQASTGAPINFELVTYSDAIKLSNQREAFITYIETKPTGDSKDFTDILDVVDDHIDDPVLFKRVGDKNLPDFYIKQAGEKMIIMDFGVVDYDLLNNGRQYILDLKISETLKEGIIRFEAVTGAMCIVFNPLIISRSKLIEEVSKLEESIPPVDELKVPSRIFKFPIAFDHSALSHCLGRYKRSQRPHAPYLPSNTEFVMRANCIETIEDFKAAVVGHTQIVVAVSFLCALPLLVHTDPRLRFLSSKYNPARTFTPAGAIGTGSIAQAIYTVDSPGGYMIWGMTLPNGFWDTFSKLEGFDDLPWILKNFDQVQFYEVTEDELTKMNNDLLTGEYKITSETKEFDFAEYSKWLKTVEQETKEIKSMKLQAIDVLSKEEEIDLAKWEEEKEQAKASKSSTSNGASIDDPNATKVSSHMAANVFKINYQKGDVLSLDDSVIVLEAMKMEISVRIKSKEGPKFEVLDILVEEGDMVNPGDLLALVKSV
ncbi:Urea amidolyase [Wickerhamomyces ciferrii]|uniref:Urea amidolyase n=1 Tax=Wickerhamomyces ciferrii (strain ATCC 14091 / BCRC 22168 / CBS 111 / JCM 3599 / NBRC 0793 / NRRL Y-1031 F-60-10) TaxID=1206466 RepID=K0L0K1_WICCF|nr:Urea amidolyase [Wickerhamomyces ciferrii]CCH47099.1 Urea amidolyase [Wickerhamomyces ciferrii]